jgi:hypothetical protein
MRAHQRQTYAVHETIVLQPDLVALSVTDWCNGGVQWVLLHCRYKILHSGLDLDVLSSQTLTNHANAKQLQSSDTTQ